MDQFFNLFSVLAENNKVAVLKKEIVVMPHKQFITYGGAVDIFYNARVEYGKVADEFFYKISGIQKISEGVNDSYNTFEQASDLFEDSFIQEEKRLFTDKTIYKVKGRISRTFETELYVKASTIERVTHQTKLIESYITE
jgi:hypothetical protein